MNPLVPSSSGLQLPSIVEGLLARIRFLEFFIAPIRNHNRRRSYGSGAGLQEASCTVLKKERR
jgi:hypothetical protein